MMKIIKDINEIKKYDNNNIIKNKAVNILEETSNKHLKLYSIIVDKI